MKKTDPIISNLEDVSIPNSESDAKSKMFWSYWIVQSLLWTMIFRRTGLKKKEADGSERDFTVEDLKEMLLKNNSIEGSEKLESDRLRGKNHSGLAASGQNQ